uniref:SAM pointed domain containing ETS transcription factor n=1 Tax=Hippocampus comes TaxID=109280 RepID=A0A3Q2Z7Q4_HIPCM
LLLGYWLRQSATNSIYLSEITNWLNLFGKESSHGNFAHSLVSKNALVCSYPQEWNCMHVYKWLLWTEHLYRLPQISTLFKELSGRDLCSMTEADFRERSSQFGDMLYAHLDIWRSANDNSWCNCPSQPIHLWQFLRELLHKPHNYSRCIRWINKEKGIFKIEDSAHVARLWGIRKNRPAMNYDKLSRSIRQYYKKGIIRKPDVSRRLVYQFVNPI